MDANTRAAEFNTAVIPAIRALPARMDSRPSILRVALIGASVVLETAIVLGFVASSVGIGAAPYPDPDARVFAPASTAPADVAGDGGRPLNPAPAPAPAP